MRLSRGDPNHGQGKAFAPACGRLTHLDANATEPGTDTEATVAGDAGPRVAPPTPHGPGSSFGRYVILEELGRGTMGVVFAAYDPTLDRRVALKLFSTSGQVQQDRVVREAQALAQVQSPLVVAVHDVGTIDGRLYLTMAFIAGQTLEAWLEAEERTEAEVLHCYLQAGLGLDAAHRAGVVHRDFKPANVMVADDGRTTVTDFGLARRSSDITPSQPATVSNAGEDSVLDKQLTRTGEVMGTPAFMSPEQWAGERGDAHSDQFSFCVALYTGLYGVAPFAGSTVTELMTAVTRSELRSPPVNPRVPVVVRRALERGLSHAADQRFTDMTALLTQLRPRPNRRRNIALAAGAVGLLAGLTVYLSTQERTPTCQDGATMAGVWNDEVRATLRSEVANSAESDSAWSTAEGILDAYASEWKSAYEVACGETRPMRREMALSCLDARRGSLASMLTPTRHSDAGTRAGRILAEGLSAIEPCLPRQSAPALAQSDTAAALARKRFMQAVDLQRGGKYDQTLAMLLSIDFSGAVGGTEVHGKALTMMANVYTNRDDEKLALKFLRQAIPICVAADDLNTAVQGAVLLADLHIHANALAPAKLQLDLADAWLGRAPGRDWLRGMILASRAALAERSFEFDRSVSLALEAVETHSVKRAPMQYAAAQRRLGKSLARAGRPDEAATVLAGAVASLAQRVHSRHLLLLTLTVQHAEAALQTGNVAAAASIVSSFVEIPW
ncbi:MAG: serine/threonine protein kinase, partial [Nannocystaceae bacterium]|nr:serine/threonine protein kinase [Nannocystaceae bacterium]